MYLNIVKWGKGEKNKIVQIPVFPILFVTDCLKKSEKLSEYLKLVNEHQIIGMHLSITSQFAMVNHYLNKRKIKALFELIKKSFGMVKFNKCFFLELNFASFSY